MMDVRSALEQVVLDETRVASVLRREVPLLGIEWETEDKDALVHTLGMNFLAALGREAGYVALVEYPVPRAKRWDKKLVRVDCAWIDREEKRPVLLGEFERYDGEAGALEKVANLLVAARGLRKPPEKLLLCLWALDGVSVGVPSYRPGEPLSVSGGPPVTCPEGSEIVLLHAVFGQRRGDFHFLRFRRSL